MKFSWGSFCAGVIVTVITLETTLLQVLAMAGVMCGFLSLWLVWLQIWKSREQQRIDSKWKSQ